MKKPLILIACLLLAGCTDADWNRLGSYGGGDEAEPEAVATHAPAPQAPAPQPMAAAPPANSDFCQSLATQDATANSFDPATQQRVLRQSYAQCLTIYSR
jgi:Tfp pilus assembly protein PilP